MAEDYRFFMILSEINVVTALRRAPLLMRLFRIFASSLACQEIFTNAYLDEAQLIFRA